MNLHSEEYWSENISSEGLGGFDSRVLLQDKFYNSVCSYGPWSRQKKIMTFKNIDTMYAQHWLCKLHLRIYKE